MRYLCKLFIAALVALPIGLAQPALAQPAPDGNSVLILGATVSGGASSLEGTKAAAQGFTVVVDSDLAWLARTTADFATFKAIILGDPTCTGPGPTTAAETNRAIWSPAITGNIVVIGTDPVFHSSFAFGLATQGDVVTDSGIAFAAAEAGKTGAYITLSCYFHGTAPGTPVPLLDQFGSFTVTGVGCFNDAHIVAVHPALTGLTDASLSDWSCSVHEAFDGIPADFLPLAIAEGVGCPPGTGTNFADGTCGTPYIIARGEELSPVACGNGILEAPEECDDGNTANGDGCSAQCTIEVPTGPVCGDGTVDPGEQCDDGNTTSGDGCSAVCTSENTAPFCGDAAPTVSSIWPPNHKMVDVGITGVTDADGDAVTITITSIKQDEPTNTIGDGNTSCDAEGVGGPAARVRAERSGSKQVPGDGRFYHIAFTADDGAGGRCTGSVAVAVPHDQSHAPVDGGPLYNSCTP